MSEAQEVEVAVEPSIPEFQSLAITIDHLVMEPHGGNETAIQSVWSTASPEQALLNQIDYFARVDGCRSPLKDMPNIIALSSAAYTDSAIYVYTPTPADPSIAPRLTNVIMSRDTFGKFVEEAESSVYLAMSAIIALAMGMGLEYEKRGLPGDLVIARFQDASVELELSTSDPNEV